MCQSNDRLFNTCNVSRTYRNDNAGGPRREWSPRLVRRRLLDITAATRTIADRLRSRIRIVHDLHLAGHDAPALAFSSVPLPLPACDQPAGEGAPPSVASPLRRRVRPLPFPPPSEGIGRGQAAGTVSAPALWRNAVPRCQRCNAAIPLAPWRTATQRPALQLCLTATMEPTC